MAEEEKVVSCDILQEKYAEVRAAGEAYKKALHGYGSVAVPETKENFYDSLQEMRKMLQERREYIYEKFEDFITSNNAYIRRGAAQNPILPPALAKYLLIDQDLDVLKNAAANQNLLY